MDLNEAQGMMDKTKGHWNAMPSSAPIPASQAHFALPSGNAAPAPSAHEALKFSVRQRQYFLERITDTTPDLIYILDLDGLHFEYANRRVCEFVGFTVSELLAMGDCTKRFVHPDDVPALAESRRRFATADESDVIESEFRVRHAGGDWRTLRARETIFARAGGMPRLILGTAQDVTEWKRSEKSLRETNELLERIFSTTHMNVAYLDRNFNFLRVNASYAETDGQSPSHYINRNYFDLCPSDGDREIFQRVIDTREPFAAYARPISNPKHPERPVTYWDFSVEPVQDAQGGVGGIIIAMLDVTIQQDARADLAESERLFRAIFDQSLQFICLISPEGVVLEMNRSALDFSHLRTPQVIGRPFWRTPWWPSSTKIQRRVREAIQDAAQGHVARYNTEIRGPNNTLVSVDFSIKPVRDKDGRIEMLICEARNISEQRRLEQRIREIAAEERERIGHSLHEILGQHLTGIAFLGKVLSQRLMPHAPNEAAEAMRIADLVTDAIRQTRDLARGLCPVSEDAEGLMDALRRLAHDVNSQDGMHCHFRCESEVLVRDAQVAMPLYEIAREAVNAAIHQRQAHEIAIRLSDTGSGLTLTVRDDGTPPPASESTAATLGILRHRAANIGALVDLKRVPGGGTIMLCWTPRPTAKKTETAG